MKLIAIGDTHGRDLWKEIVKQDFDKVIFIGDYFDSFDIPFSQQMKNFQEILEFKIANIDKVVLLFGNHDYHYISEQRYSGYQPEHEKEIQNILEDALRRGLLQMCTLDDGFLFSHAGVTKTWAEFAHIDLKNIEGSINKCFIRTPQMFKFMDYSGADGSGDNIYQSPIWVRPDSLVKDMISGYTQVVGHTRFPDVRGRAMNSVDEKNIAIFIDTLDVGEYLEIKDETITAKKL